MIRFADKDVISSCLDVETLSAICIMLTSPNGTSCRNLGTGEPSEICFFFTLCDWSCC